MVDDDVAQGADRVVEVAAVLDAEALGHRDLDALQGVAVPHRLEHRVGEPEVEHLLQPHLPQEVVDPVDLRLVDVGVQLARQGPGRLLVVAEGLLDDHPGVGRQAGVGQPPDDGAEQERRYLQVVHRLLGPLDRLRHPGIGVGLAEVTET